MEVSRFELEANNLKGKLESVRTAAGKARSGRGELEAKLKDYQNKVKESL